MRRVLAVTPVVGLLVALGAMLAPDPPLLVRHWASYTIYPWWTPLLLVVAIGVAVVVLSVDEPGPRAAAVCATGIVAAQVGGLGLWAHKHWRPAFGMGGGYAGGMHELERLAWVVAAGGMLACVASVALLVVRGDWPKRDVAASAWRRVVLGLAVIVGLPALLSGGVSSLMDATSLGAMSLVYGIPWGGALVASRWLASTAYSAVLATCAIGAGLAGAHSSDEIAYRRGGVVLLGTAAVFALVLCLEWLPRRGRGSGDLVEQRRGGADMATGG
jgi:hypothetical protein